jgi:hypothetical protein
MNETGKMLIKIGKRGRKHGLGIVWISQRSADVKKDFITQANWLVRHRPTRENDTNVVGRIIGSEYAKRVNDIEDGQAVMTHAATQRLSNSVRNFFRICSSSRGETKYRKMI